MQATGRGALGSKAGDLDAVLLEFLNLEAALQKACLAQEISKHEIFKVCLRQRALPARAHKPSSSVQAGRTSR